MFTDIVGYTALMGNDDRKAFEILSKNRALQKPIIEQFNGRWIKEMGDGVIASFNTASDALEAAKKIQEACTAIPDLQLRIGIHLGEVVFENNDVFGDGVNIASRIETLGVAGGVLFSKAVRDQVKNKPEFQLQSLGTFDFKNVSEPIEVFALSNPGFAVPKREAMQGKLQLPQEKSSTIKFIIGLALVAAVAFGIWFFVEQKKDSGHSGDRSIAVLPFVNMSDDKEQEYFSDGISEEIINKLAQSAGLQVKGRTSSFAFKGKNMDLKLIGAQLNVSYLLEGSVRKAGNVLRITAQLIKVSDGNHLYSQTFDKELKDIFTIQDEISLAILNAVKIRLLGAEKDAVLKKYTDNVEAYQLYLQGRYYYNKYTQDAMMKAIEYFDRAIAIDPTYAIAFSGKAYCYMTLNFFGLPSESTMPQALKAAQQSLDLDAGIAQSHLAVGRIRFHTEWNFKQAEEHFMKALSLEPNNAETHVQLAMLSAALGNKEKAMSHMQIAVSLDPFSLMNLFMATVAPGIFGEMQTVLENGKRMIDLDSTFYGGHFWVGFAYVQSGKPQEGLMSFQLAAQLGNDPLTLSFLGSVYGSMGDKLKAREVIKQLETMKVNGYIGDVYASIGEVDSTFVYYNKAVEKHEGNMLWVKGLLLNAPAFQNDPRTRTLLDRIGLPY
jgi:TolB-like protein/Tfp pilus assembly protein PilF